MDIQELTLHILGHLPHSLIGCRTGGRLQSDAIGRDVELVHVKGYDFCGNSAIQQNLHAAVKPEGVWVPSVDIRLQLQVVMQWIHI